MKETREKVVSVQFHHCFPLKESYLVKSQNTQMAAGIQLPIWLLVEPESYRNIVELHDDTLCLNWLLNGGRNKKNYHQVNPIGKPDR